MFLGTDNAIATRSYIAAVVEQIMIEGVIRAKTL
jgi:hypothetical protein